MKTGGPKQRGFTFLEMMISVGIFVLLVTSAFMIVAATSQLMTEVSVVQNKSAVRLRFIEACRNAFESMNLNSALEFHYVARSSETVDTYLSFIETPKAFDFGFNHSADIERTVLAAEVQPNGFIRSRVYFFTREGFESARQSDFQSLNSPHVDLIPRMRQLSWLFYNERMDRWEPDMDAPFPGSLVKLIILVEGSDTPTETVFHYPGSRP